MAGQVKVIVLAGLPRARPRQSSKMAGSVGIIVLMEPAKGKASEESEDAR
jgi:hypothetical protein